MSIRNDTLSKMMKASELKMPFADFEDQVMYQVKKESKNRFIIRRYRILSGIFFLAGAILGFVVNAILEKTQRSFLGFSPDVILLVFQLSFVFVLLICLDAMVRFASRKKFV